MYKIVGISAAALALAGCATVTRGTTDQVQVISQPSDAQVTTSIGNSCPSTPCTFEVSRKTEFTVVFRKAGFEEQFVPVKTRVAGAGVAGMAGNILLGGVVGIVADAATGATLEHYPNPVNVTLRPASVATLVPTPTRPKRLYTPRRKAMPST